MNWSDWGDEEVGLWVVLIGDGHYILSHCWVGTGITNITLASELWVTQKACQSWVGLTRVSLVSGVKFKAKQNKTLKTN